jgi:hypothetical protein
MESKQGSSAEMTWRQAVEFLVRLADVTDPEKLKQWELLRLVEECSQFLDLKGDGQPARELAQAKRKPATLKPLIETVRKLVQAVADHARIEVRVGQTKAVLDASSLGDERGAAFTDGKLVDVITAQAVEDLGDAEPWQICKCRWRDCGRIFLAERKGQMFCSHRCASAASSARYQERKRISPIGRTASGRKLRASNIR